MSNELVKSVHIQNFKSVVDLSLDLGTFNVLIGENGCGKSNILEALAFGAAANANKLDYEFLGSRGIRVTNPEFMYSAFDKKENRVRLSYRLASGPFSHYEYVLMNDSDNPKKWVDESRDFFGKLVDELLQPIMSESDENARIKKVDEFNRGDGYTVKVLERYSDEIKKWIGDAVILRDNSSSVRYILERNITSFRPKPIISNFIIYAPEQSNLRKYEESNQIYPLGIRGEGLFQYLKDLSTNEQNTELLKELKENLTLLDWYESFELPDGSISNDFSLNIKDKYLSSELQYFDQRSTNEGFLYLLFYSTLFHSKDTPAFFAIDNIDASLNPKLCMQLTRSLAELAQKNGKQVIVTTQNPAILDGLNLKDDNQRLFVVRRNDEGHTKASRVEYNAERRMKLSEVWTSGFIGGLPDNF